MLTSEIIDYTFDSVQLKNPDGTMNTTAINCTLTRGPGTTFLGNYPISLSFGSYGKANVIVDKQAFNMQEFCIRIAFLANKKVTGKNGLITSDCFPFQIYINEVDGESNFKISITIFNALGVAEIATQYIATFLSEQWYILDIVYDTDTIALLIDGNVWGINAFPNGTISPFSTGNKLFIGTAFDNVDEHFEGKIAALKIYNGIPSDLQTALDESRNDIKWFLTYKYELVKHTLNLGAPISSFGYDVTTNTFMHPYKHGIIMYNPDLNCALEMHGAIYELYKQLSISKKLDLGYAVSDEEATTKQGGRKNLFLQGGIYWSNATKAVIIDSQIYLDYEHGDKSVLLGLPISSATILSDGIQQNFENGIMYYKTGTTRSFEVHGSILQRFLSSGALPKWGYPVSNEMDIRKETFVIGKSSEFEGCTIFYSSATGAMEVHGDILKKYKDLNGPLGDIGFPTSNETDLPGIPSPGRYNTFQNGSILWFGSWNNIIVCFPFQIYIGRINTKEQEGFTMGENDLYLKITVKDHDNILFDTRFPESGDYGGHNIIDLKQTLQITIVPNSPLIKIEVIIEVWDRDGGLGFNDAHLGKYSKMLNIDNAWGMYENNGVFDSGSFDNINSISWAVHPVINEDKLTNIQKWWGVKNVGTPTISYNQYAAAFRDVDSKTEFWDVSDWVKKAFYEKVIQGLSKNGNCFGMSLEAINSWKHCSLFSLPLDRFTNWNTVVNEFNIKHQYQVGASALWWFVGEFLSGMTHSPINVFSKTYNEYNRGNNPIICITQKYNFGGAPHAILPFEWDTSTNPWLIRVFDPNYPNQVRTLLVDKVNDTFFYQGAEQKNYSGSEWSGGRFYYIPWSVVNERPRTPWWEAIVLILSAKILLVGENCETNTLTDINGKNLDILENKGNNNITDSTKNFFSFKGFDGDEGVLASELYLGMEGKTIVKTSLDEVNFKFGNSHLSFENFSQDKRFSDFLRPIVSNINLFGQLKDRDLKDLLYDQQLISSLDLNNRYMLTSPVEQLGGTNDILHKISGKENGQFEYAIKNKYTEFLIKSSISKEESHFLHLQNIGKHSIILLKTTQNKSISIDISNKLNVKKDNIRIYINNLPTTANNTLQICIYPGMQGLDIITSEEKITSIVIIETVIEEKKDSNFFYMEWGGGIRFRPSTILTNKNLKVGQINNLFGRIKNVKNIKHVEDPML